MKSPIPAVLNDPAQYQRKGYESVRGNEPQAHLPPRTSVMPACKQAYPSQAHLTTLVFTRTSTCGSPIIMPRTPYMFTHIITCSSNPQPPVTDMDTYAHVRDIHTHEDSAFRRLKVCSHFKAASFSKPACVYMCMFVCTCKDGVRA